MRSRLGFKSRDLVWIALCVQAYTKGLDRIVRALREFPAAKLLVVGLSPASTRATRAISTTAAKLGVGGRIAWAGHREDVPELMAAADLLVHPARNDTTGTVILEAIVNGLPVVTTSVCGYAQHVNDAQAGIVIDEPFGFRGFCAALTAAHDAGRRTRWSVSARQYGEQSYLFDGRMRAAELILAAAERVRRRAGIADDPKTAAGEVVYLRETTRSRAGGPSHR
jgi:UDP-glucose:(heptosyl)LPS alpha-1,3-glucosyltransferase